MTDLDRFVELYRTFGIECVVNTHSDGRKWIRLEDAYLGSDSETTRSEKFDGYTGFYTQIQFDKDGKFVLQGFWE